MGLIWSYILSLAWSMFSKWLLTLSAFLVKAECLRIASMLYCYGFLRIPFDFFYSLFSLISKLKLFMSFYFFTVFFIWRFFIFLEILLESRLLFMLLNPNPGIFCGVFISICYNCWWVSFLPVKPSDIRDNALSTFSYLASIAESVKSLFTKYFWLYTDAETVPPWLIFLWVLLL